MDFLLKKTDQRRLSAGYGWQRYTTMAVRMINQSEFDLNWGGSFSAMQAQMDNWKDKVAAFINRRANQLGLSIEMVGFQLVEEPNESKILEIKIWESANLKFVWSIWCHLLGPMHESMITLEPQPLFGFWPRDMKFRGRVPEIFDAEKLTSLEQSSWDHRDIRIAL